MKSILLISFLCLTFVKQIDAQKSTVYAEAGLGWGQTLFFGDMSTQLIQSYGGSFSPGIGNNLMMAFYVAPASWKGLGIGSRIKGTFGTSVQGDFGDSYIFNYYNLALAAKFHPFSQTFNKGLYLRGSYGFGQFTSKRVNETNNLYKHQYAIGGSLLGSLGWSFPLKKSSLNLELEFDSSSRGGTIDGKGNATYRSGQIGGNILISF